MKKFSVFCLVFICLFCFSGCNYSEEVDPAPVDESEVSTTSSTVVTSAEIPSADGTLWDYYINARQKTDEINKKELKTIVYTKSGLNSQTINLRIILDDIFGVSPLIWAEGSVKVKDKIIPINMYFKESKLYSSTENGKNKQDIDFETALNQIDFTHELKKAFSFENVYNITLDESPDGNSFIYFDFYNVEINEIITNGHVDLVIDNKGIIISETYNIENSSNDSAKILQSVETSLISYYDDVPEISFPDLSEY